VRKRDDLLVTARSTGSGMRNSKMVKRARLSERMQPGSAGDLALTASRIPQSQLEIEAVFTDPIVEDVEKSLGTGIKNCSPTVMNGTGRPINLRWHSEI
jgi:hypothetical protein